MQTLVADKRESDDDSGLLYNLFVALQEWLTRYNDTVKGRCAVCLEDFVQPGQDEDQAFTERIDLVRIDECFHRFHLICVYRDWFMKRVAEKDEFGGLIEFQLPEVKRCPICRREVSQDEQGLISTTAKEHPDLDDHGYGY